jgi:hypothetical protein
MTLDILLDAPMALVGEILSDASGSVSKEMMCVFQRGQGRWKRRMEVGIRWSGGKEDVVE